MSEGQKIVTNLWFESDAEEAVGWYTRVFDGEVVRISRYGPEGPGPEGAAMVIDFRLFGQRFSAINGYADFPFTEAISLLVQCDSQAEIDRYWGALLEGGGEAIQCGWLKDRYGLRWQIVPRKLERMLASDDREAAGRARKAMFGMKKIDLPALEEAYGGDS
ncbi:MAG: VOC family protein [Myxococcota bacterium]|nr:VOC family protein [Myxococcota bacterium]